MDEVERRLEIPYVKLRFDIIFVEDTILPKDKVSALRGGMGEALLLQNCIGDRDCMNCRFTEECIVYRTLYTPMKRMPAFMHGLNSIGYLIECENNQTNFKAGKGFSFYLILFGKNISYFGQYHMAFRQLGIAGIGKHKARYLIRDIRNAKNISIIHQNQVVMSKYHPETVYEYVQRREKELSLSGYQNEMIFHTPLCLKYQGEYIQRFHTEAIFRAIFRRIMMLDYFVELYIEQPGLEAYPAITKQDSFMRMVKRYSTTKKATIRMYGLMGTVQFEDVPQGYLPYILAGELLHIGKNSSFGFGKYSFR